MGEWDLGLRLSNTKWVVLLLGNCLLGGSLNIIELPKDIISKICYYNAPIITKSWEKDHAYLATNLEKIDFPATAPIQFFNDFSGNSSIKASIQLFSNCGDLAASRIESCDGLTVKETLWKHFKIIDSVYEYVKSFDVHYSKLTNVWYGVIFYNNHISFRCISKHQRLLDIPMQFSGRPSICFHHNDAVEHVSYVENTKAVLNSTLNVICFNQKNTKIDIIESVKHCRLIRKTCEFYLKRFPIKLIKNGIVYSAPKVEKHVYIGAQTYIFLIKHELFLGTIDHGILRLYLQTMKSKEGQQLKIASFAVNYDDDKKTDRGRCRFFSFLTTCGSIYVIDLCSNTIVLIKKNEFFYDSNQSLSFCKNIIYVWKKIIPDPWHPSSFYFSISELLVHGYVDYCTTKLLYKADKCILQKNDPVFHIPMKRFQTTSLVYAAAMVMFGLCILYFLK